MESTGTKVLCKFCNINEATLHFGNMLSATHYPVLNCCELCATEKQLAYARERATKIPELEKKVYELRKKFKKGNDLNEEGNDLDNPNFITPRGTDIVGI